MVGLGEGTMGIGGVVPGGGVSFGCGLFGDAGAVPGEGDGPVIRTRLGRAAAKGVVGVSPQGSVVA